jgi:hypothetical protein
VQVASSDRGCKLVESGPKDPDVCQVEIFVCSLCGYREPDRNGETNTLLYWKKGDTDSINGSAIDAQCTDHRTESKEYRIKKLLLSRDFHV